jgi:xanthine dehydrogenase iron-sulfur cluster and FAD-binding subunit A
MQVPSHVEYERATSVEHALELLARFGPESRVLAGGHSLIPMMKLRLAQPETLIDINGIRGLSRITADGDELRIGALVRFSRGCPCSRCLNCPGRAEPLDRPCPTVPESAAMGGMDANGQDG